MDRRQCEVSAYAIIITTTIIIISVILNFCPTQSDIARHDNDDRYPRTRKMLYELNDKVATKFFDTFRDKRDPRIPLSVPIVPTFGNNDIWPHNIFERGPNPTTRTFMNLWQNFVPEYEDHTFEMGGYYISEVIPNRLAVISLNTLYLYGANAAVDGCTLPEDPGYRQFEWLRYRLEEARFRGLKVWIMGHVPPALNKGEGKGWYYDCARKYYYWMHAYRDVVVGHLYGHQNVDHFDLMTADFVDYPEDDFQSGEDVASIAKKKNRELDYLTELRRSVYSSVPENSSEPFDQDWMVYTVSASIIPKYFPGLRIIEYNITGLEDNPPVLQSQGMISRSVETVRWFRAAAEDMVKAMKKKNHKKNRKNHNGKAPPKITPPAPPSPPYGTPPGPAFSPQPLSPIKYTQYFLNISRLNEEYDKGNRSERHDFEVEYSSNDKPFNLQDLTVPSYLKLARRLGSTGDKHDQEEYKELWSTFLRRAVVGVKDLLNT